MAKRGASKEKRLLERYPSIARHYDIQVIAGESGQQAQPEKGQAPSEPAPYDLQSLNKL